MNEINSTGWTELRDYLCDRLIMNDQVFTKLRFRGHLVAVESDPSYSLNSDNPMGKFHLWVDPAGDSIREDTKLRSFEMSGLSYGKALWEVVKFLDDGLSESVTVNSQVTSSCSKPSTAVDANGVNDVIADLVAKAKLLGSRNSRLSGITPSITIQPNNSVIASFFISSSFGDSDEVIIDLTPVVHHSIEYVKKLMELKSLS